MLVQSAVWISNISVGLINTVEVGRTTPANL